jgi:sulfur carrier protein ThiS
VNIKVKLSRTNETKQLKIKEGSTIKDLLKTINLKPDTVIVLNKEIPIPIDDELKDKQEIIVINVSSGG